MKSNSPIYFLAALMALVPSQAIAEQANEAGRDFFSVPEISEIEGYRFFSGRMNVKIREDQGFAEMGVNPAFVQHLQNRAFNLVEGQIVRDFENIDTLVLDIPDGFNEESYARRLMATGLFEWVEPDYGYFPAQVSVDDPRYDDQWHLPRIQADFAWAETLATGQKVAVLDSGVDTDHPDLVDQLLSGWDSENDNDDIEDENGHGTHVIGIAAAVTNNATGVAGVAYGAGIVPIDISDLPSGSAFESAMTAGVDWVMANHPDCKVVNISFGGGASNSRENTATKFRNAGGLLFNSGGNSNEFYPEGVQPNLVLVGNSTIFDTASFDTAYGPGIDIFAPGSNILSTVVDGNYQAFSGTSMASPLAAGVAALVWAYDPTLTPDEVEERMVLGQVPVDDETIMESSNGRIDALNAVLGINGGGVLTKEVTTNVSLSLLSGSLAGGGAASVAASDDAFFAITSEPSERFAQIGGYVHSSQVTETDLTVFAGLEIDVEAGTIEGEASVLVYIYNFEEGAYDYLWAFRDSMDDSSGRIRISETDVADYISPTGEIRVAVRGHMPKRAVNGTVAPFTMRTDMLTVTQLLLTTPDDD